MSVTNLSSFKSNIEHHLLAKFHSGSSTKSTQTIRALKLRLIHN